MILRSALLLALLSACPEVAPSPPVEPPSVPETPTEPPAAPPPAPEAPPGWAAAPAAPEVPADVSEVVKSHASELRHCYEQSLSVQPALAGRIEVRWTLAAGHVRDVAILSDTTGLPSLASCIRDRTALWTFPADAPQIVTWPFVFRPSI